MSSFRYFTVLVISITNCSHAQTSRPAAPSAPGTDKIAHLDQFVVSAGHDPKTSFDLAQGTSVLAGEELHRLAQSTLGETLSSLPGINSTAYGPGASRPIIRGLGGDRVRVLDNGVGALDASNVSPDHNTAIEPLFASRIEVLRGPSTLLYGSSAIGGAVNIISNALPFTAPDGRSHGAIELRGGGAARERAAIVSIGGGANAFSAQVNLLQQKTDDLRIPDVARIDEEAPARQVRGILPGSDAATFSSSFGTGLFWKVGRAGASISHYETEYGVPNGEDIRIRMRHTRIDLEGEITRPFGLWRGAKVRFGKGDYTHAELGDAGKTVSTTFNNKAWEGRVELPHLPVGALAGMIGFQATASDFEASGEEVVSPAALTRNGAFFALEELKFGPQTTLQFGARYEAQQIALGTVNTALPRVPGYAARSGQTKRSDGISASVGLVLYPSKDWSVAAAIASSQRLPTTPELFANGPHGGTGAYEVGSSQLNPERSIGFDLNVRRRVGFLTGSIGGFINQFRDYIFERELPAKAIPAMANPEGLTPFQFVATDARFIGGEAELTLHLLENQQHRIHLDLSADSVRARETENNAPLPRIPPVRYSARLNYEDGRWQAVIEVRHSARQSRVADTETTTAGSTLINTSVSYLIPTARVTYEFFVRGRNLTNRTVREHTSFLKDFAPQAGRGVIGGIRLSL